MIMGIAAFRKEPLLSLLGALVAVSVAGLAIRYATRNDAAEAPATVPHPATLPATVDSVIGPVPLKAWQDMSRPIELPGQPLFFLTVLSDKSSIVMAARDNGRVSRLTFVDCATLDRSEANVFSDPDDRELTIGDMLLGPDPQSIWLYITVGQSYAGQWCRYDVKNRRIDAPKERYRAILAPTEEDREKAKPGGPLPVWSALGHRFFESEREARDAGVVGFWQGYHAMAASRLSRVSWNESYFEFVSGGSHQYLFGLKGKASTYLGTFVGADAYAYAAPQDCWFVIEDGNTVVYKFYNEGRGGAAKAGLRKRYIERVWDLPGQGVLVRSWELDRDKPHVAGAQHLDLIPQRR
ncbi:MAG: hypothetical protein WCK05_12975 [Planctomycetota bacterium]